MSNKNEIFEYLIDQLRQQVNNSRSEDLAHEVLSLKNQLRDASVQIKELHMALATATGDVEAYKLVRKGGYISRGQSYVVGEHAPGPTVNCRCTQTPVPPEQSGCRKEDVQECEHDWVEFHGLFIAEGDLRNEPGYTFCRKCGLKEYSRKCEHEWSMVTGDGPSFYECDVCGARSKDLPYDLRWLAL